MHTNGKISAYGGVSRFVNSFSVGDYAFYYVKGKGVVAAGKVLSDTAETAEYEETNESYKMVQIIVLENIPLSENQLKVITAKRLKEVFRPDRGFYFASTVKKHIYQKNRPRS